MGNTLRAGLDWFSASRADGPGGWEWAMKGIHAINAIGDMGHELRAHSQQGYQGIRAGGRFVGSRHDGYFVQITGHHADEYFSELMCEECNVTRIDYQVTVQYDDMPTELGEEVYNASRVYASSLPESKRWKTYRFEGDDGGYSAYIGSTGSKQRACVYNKDKQANTPEYERCWRFEVRYRHELAHKWAIDCLNATAARPDYVLEVVASWMQSRGIYRAEFGEYGERPLARVSARTTDVERKLDWLRRQVAPSVKWLQSRTDSSTIMAALGLTEL